MADQYTPTPIKTKTNGDVVAKIVDTAGTNVAGVDASNNLKTVVSNAFALDASVTGLQVSQGSTTSGEKGTLIQGAVTTAAPSYTTAQTSPLSLDTSGNLRTTSTISGTVSENLAQVNGVTVLTGSGATGTGSQRVTVAVDSATVAGSASLPAGTNIIGKVTTDQTTHGTTDLVAADITKVGGVAVTTGTGVSGTGVLRVAPATDVIQQVSATTAANTVANPIFAKLSDGAAALGTAANPLIVQTEGEAATSLKDSGQVTSAALAAGASVLLSTADITTGKTGRLMEITAASSVRLKVDLQTFDGTTATVWRTFFIDATSALIYTPDDRLAITQAGGTGHKFRLNVTNMDNALAADVYGSFMWDEV